MLGMQNEVVQSIDYRMLSKSREIEISYDLLGGFKSVTHRCNLHDELFILFTTTTTTTTTTMPA